MGSVVQPNEWVGFKLPSGAVKVIQAIPNTYGPHVCLPCPLDPERELTCGFQDDIPRKVRLVPE